jgi:predicted enzyme related to lactoylglutathione lyase
MDMKLASTRLVTNDVRALARFYAAITGFKPVGIEDYVELETPAGTLAISSKRAVDIFNAGAAIAAANRSVIVEFEVENVDHERSRLDRLIGEFVMEPTDQPWGSRSMLFRDPDGNLINFFAQTPADSGSCCVPPNPNGFLRS